MAKEILLDPLITFSIILVISLLIPELIHRFKITHVPFYIMAGILIGPFGLGIVAHEAIRFLADIGLLVLVFLAGLEIRESRSMNLRESSLFCVFMGVFSFAGGFILGFFYFHDLLTSLLMGTILVSSSVGEIIPIVNSTDYLKKRYSDIIIPGIITLDATSLIALGVVLKFNTAPGDMLFFFLGLIALILFSFYALPKILSRLFMRKTRKPREADLKVVLSVLITIVAMAEIIGLHGIVTAFIVGVVMGEYIPSERVFDKIHGLGHGLLIPVFFVVLGMTLDLSILYTRPGTIILPAMLILSLVVSKVLGGTVYTFSRGRSARDGVILGVTLMPQLSATLAATAIGYEFGIFNADALLAVVIMAMFSTLLTPFLVRYLTKEKKIRMGVTGHTVIIGFGRTSSKVVNILHYMKKDVVVIDTNLNKTRTLERRGIPTVFGNGAEREVLLSAGVQKAKVVLITLPDEHETYVCAKHVKDMNPGAHIIAKIHTEGAFKRLNSEKLVDSYIWPEKISSHEASEKVIKYLETEEYSFI